MFGSAGMMELVDDMRLGRAETPPPRGELRRRQRLRAHDEHLAAKERLLDLGELRIRQRFREIDVERFEPEAGIERTGPERHVAIVAHVRGRPSSADASDASTAPSGHLPRWMGSLSSQIDLRRIRLAPPTDVT